MGLYPIRAMERAMKVQEVILRAIGGQITWIQAAEVLGISDRTIRRMRWRLERHGYSGLFDRRRQRPSPKRVPVATVEKVLRLYREHYFDFNVRHFHEKLRGDHGIELSYSWVKAALRMAGLVERRAKRGKHRKRRERRPLPGMMLHIDGSTHARCGRGGRSSRQTRSCLASRGAAPLATLAARPLGHCRGRPQNPYFFHDRPKFLPRPAH